jgi:hypothetical protein
MFNRILRLLSTGISAYSFYSNPLRFFITLAGIILVPYLAYIFWGAAVIFALAIAGLYFIYKTIRSSIENRSSSY